MLGALASGAVRYSIGGIGTTVAGRKASSASRFTSTLGFMGPRGRASTWLCHSSRHAPESSNSRNVRDGGESVRIVRIITFVFRSVVPKKTPVSCNKARRRGKRKRMDMRYLFRSTSSRKAPRPPSGAQRSRTSRFLREERAPARGGDRRPAKRRGFGGKATIRRAALNKTNPSIPEATY